MKTPRITKKLREAITILADETKADISDDAFFEAVRTGKLKPTAIYKAMSMMRYTWHSKRGYWIWKPRHMRSIKRMFSIVRKIDDELFRKAEQ